MTAQRNAMNIYSSMFFFKRDYKPARIYLLMMAFSCTLKASRLGGLFGPGKRMKPLGLPPWPDQLLIGGEAPGSQQPAAFGGHSPPGFQPAISPRPRPRYPSGEVDLSWCDAFIQEVAGAKFRCQRPGRNFDLSPQLLGWSSHLGTGYIATVVTSHS